MPCVFKNSNVVTLLGKTSGGGSCVVLPLTTAYGTFFRISGPSRLAFTMNGSFPEEAIMIEAKDSGAQSRIVSALNTRLADVLVQAENYDAENYALAKQCKVITSGNYVALFVSPHHAAMESAFNSAVK